MTAAHPDPSGTVVEVIREVLGCDELPMAENFFRLGGNSLDMVRVIALLRRHGLGITVRQFLADPTATGVIQGVTPISTAG